MTRNQVEFAQVRENARHNLATEAKDIQSLAEAVRHNQQEEGINWYNASTLAALRQAQSDNYSALTQLTNEQTLTESERRKLIGAQTDTEGAKKDVYFSEVPLNEARTQDLYSQIENRLKMYELTEREKEAAIAKIEAEITRSKFQNAADVARILDTVIDDVLDGMGLLSGKGRTAQSFTSGVSYLTS